MIAGLFDEKIVEKSLKQSQRRVSEYSEPVLCVRKWTPAKQADDLYGVQILSEILCKTDVKQT